MDRREFRDLVPPDSAREALAELDLAADTEKISLTDADGRILAKRVDAPLDVPGFDRSAMDGYAVRASDTFGSSEDDTTTLQVVGTVHAGHEPDADVGSGEAIQVATGAVLPPGADAVVPVERTLESENTVEVTTGVAPGDHVMPRGADIAAGDRALGPGTVLGPRHLGVLAALGRDRVPVQGRPDVAVVSTGEELIQPGTTPEHATGQIYDVNGHTIAAAVEAAGGRATRYAPPSDEPERLEETLADAVRECDLVVTSGSTSAGAADLLYRLVEEHGEILVHGVAIKPGRPLLIGRVFETPYVGLPGYPVSALSVFRTFVAPRLHAPTDRPTSETATAEATLATRVRYDGGRRRLVAVGLTTDGTGGHVAYAPVKGSGATTTLVETDGIVVMPAETSLLAAGETVTVELFDDTPIPTVLGVGDSDPAFATVLDTFDASRFLSLGTSDAVRWLEDDIPDVVVGPLDGGEDLAGEILDSWEREWGLVLPAGNPADLTTLSDLLDRDLRFANLEGSLSIRSALETRLADIEAEDGAGAIDGYYRALPGIESAARSVDAGRTDVGLGLRVTADRIGLGFVPVGTQTLGVVANPDRSAKSSVDRLADRLHEQLPSLIAEMPGYGTVD